MAKSRRESPLLSIPFLRLRGARGVMKGFAEGKITTPGPGTNVIAFRHCEERSDEAISKWVA
jgi:hypothetical protein